MKPEFGTLIMFLNGGSAAEAAKRPPLGHSPDDKSLSSAHG